MGRESIAAASRGIADIVRRPRYQRVALLAGGLYLLIYLYSLRHLLWIPPRGDWALLAIEVAEGWPEKLWKAVAPFSFEPVVAIYLGGRLGILLAAPNLLLGLALGVLVGLNVAVAIAHMQRQRACCRPGVGLVGALPGLLTGFTCCAPTVALALGANSALAFIALRSSFIPLSFLLLAGGLVWGTIWLEQATPPGVR